MRKQKRFTSKLDINAAIIAARRHCSNNYRLARGHEVEMKRWWALANDPEIEPGKQEYYRGKGFEEKRLMQRNLTLARRLEDETLVKLGNALAEFQTVMLEFAKDDTGVVLH